MNRKTFFLILDIVLILFSGTFVGLNGKIQYQTQSNGLPDLNGQTLRNFEKPWFQVLLMFLGEFLCLPIFYIIKYFQSKISDLNEDQTIISNINPQGEVSSLTIGSIPPQKTFIQKYLRFLVCIPAIFDMIAAGMVSIGILYLEASISQMLRGCYIIFIGVFSRLILKSNLNRYKWSGIAITMIGITIISLEYILKAVFLEDSTIVNKISAKNVIIGVFLTILSQIISSLQSVFEEYLLRHQKISPQELIGLEGMYGSIFTSTLLIIFYYAPGASVTKQNIEDTLDTFSMLKNSPALIGICVSYLLMIAVFNFSGLRITKKLSAVHRALLSTVRGVSIWIIEVFIFYVMKSSIYGTPLDAYSLMKVDGFALLIFGTIVYNLNA